MSDRITATIRKNATEEIRVSLTEFKGHDLIDVRIYADPYDDHGQGRVATRKGLCVKVALLPELIAALQQAEAEARKTGLL